MSRIYTASDLSTKRRELLDAARAGYAQIRDKDGTGLVVLPQEDFERLNELANLFLKLITLDSTFEKPAAERRSADLGEFAWLAAFDEDDQRTFRLELREALATSMGSRSTKPVEGCLNDWRATAAALSNEKGRRILTSKGEGLDSFREVRRPK
jgi:hypothetical protein